MNRVPRELRVDLARLGMDVFQGPRLYFVRDPGGPLGVPYGANLIEKFSQLILDVLNVLLK